MLETVLWNTIFTQVEYCAVPTPMENFLKMCRFGVFLNLFFQLIVAYFISPNNRCLDSLLPFSLSTCSAQLSGVSAGAPKHQSELFWVSYQITKPTMSSQSLLSLRYLQGHTCYMSGRRKARDAH